jgi:hypothetical protein
MKKAAAKAVASGSRAVGKAVKKRLASKAVKQEFIDQVRGK